MSQLQIYIFFVEIYSPGAENLGSQAVELEVFKNSTCSRLFLNNKEVFILKKKKQRGREIINRNFRIPLFFLHFLNFVLFFFTCKAIFKAGEEVGAFPLFHSGRKGKEQNRRKRAKKGKKREKEKKRGKRKGKENKRKEKQTTG